MTLSQPAQEIAKVIGTELGLLVKLARHENSTTADVIDAIQQLPDEDVRPVLLGAVLVLSQGDIIE